MGTVTVGAEQEDNAIGEGVTEDFRCVDGQVLLRMFQAETPGIGAAAATLHTLWFLAAYSA